MRALQAFVVSLLMLSIGQAGATDGQELGTIRSLMEDGQLATAGERLDAFMAQHPQDTDARFLKGLLLVKAGRSEDAVEVFAALAREYPDLPEPHNNLAVLYAADGNYEKARESLLLAINTHPSYATAHENLGDLYAKMAAAAYDSALALDQGNRGAQAKLALVNELFSERTEQSVPGEVDSVTAGTDHREAVDGAQSRSAAMAVADKDKVLLAVSDWATAWSTQDVDRYLAHYATGFQPPRGLSRARWEAQRRQRLAKPSYIQVSVIDPEVEMHAPGRAQVSFVQTYRSNTYSDRTRKSMQMTRVGDEWKILSEQVVQ
ncbi:MAG: tetratricopeptide repeat protein [Gammaproteobacteria bacterium]|nr:tetratricopeptide repeat protein [Gammaproteobacteria bacterium]